MGWESMQWIKNGVYKRKQECRERAIKLQSDLHAAFVRQVHG